MFQPQTAMTSVNLPKYLKEQNNGFKLCKILVNQRVIYKSQNQSQPSLKPPKIRLIISKMSPKTFSLLQKLSSIWLTPCMNPHQELKYFLWKNHKSRFLECLPQNSLSLQTNLKNIKWLEALQFMTQMRKKTPIVEKTYHHFPRFQVWSWLKLNHKQKLKPPLLWKTK